jgi:alcohol dehydrogenase
MRLPDYFHFSMRVRLIAGYDALERLPGLLRDLSCQHPLILTDQNVTEAGLLELVDNVLTRAAMSSACTRMITPADSQAEAVNAATAAYTAAGCDGIIALGGGSVIDMAKGVTLLLSCEPQISDIRAYARHSCSHLTTIPCVAIPTTSGTGSEVTRTAAITDTPGTQMLRFSSETLQCSAALIDPRMSTTLPSGLSASTGMDALSHAFEAYTGLGKNPLSDGLSVQAIELISAHLEQVTTEPADLTARMAMAVGSTMAGQASDNSPPGITHAIAHALSDLCGVHHGSAVSILLPYGLEYNEHKITGELEELARLITAGASADDAIAYLRALNEQLSATTEGAHKTRLHDITDQSGAAAVRPEHLPLVARRVLGDPLQFTNPEQFEYQDVLNLLEAAYWGYPLDRTLITQGKI